MSCQEHTTGRVHRIDLCDAVKIYRRSTEVSGNKLRVHLVSFCDSRYRARQRYFENQAQALWVFDSVSFFSENDLSTIDWGSLEEDPRTQSGYGFYRWKPFLIDVVLNQVEDGDLVLYLDAGFEMNCFGKERFLTYLTWASECKSSVLAFQYPGPVDAGLVGREQDLFTDRMFSKAEAIHALIGERPSESILDSGQIASGAIFLRNGVEARSRLQMWKTAAYQGLFDERWDREIQDQQFVEHRHDQSAWSLISKAEGIDTISASERWLAPTARPYGSWSDLCKFPLWASRAIRRGGNFPRCLCSIARMLHIIRLPQRTSREILRRVERVLKRVQVIASLFQRRRYRFPPSSQTL